MKINSEKGQALPLVMIAVVLGALVVPPFLGYADSSIIGSRHYAGAIYSEYAADSGVEDAIWRLTYGGLTSNLTYPGSTVTYTLPEAINLLTTNVTISAIWQPIASDNFDSGGFSGGTGWLDSWAHSASAVVTNSGGPLGTYHLRLTGSSGVATRSVNLYQQIQIHLIVWAKFTSWEPSDTTDLMVSSDNVNWSSAYTWRDGQDDGTYRSYDIPLDSFNMTNPFWISFQSHISGSDTIYFDKLDVVWETPYPTTIAWDYFESGSGNWSGGGGWTADWTHSGSTSIVTTGSPYEGLYHLMLQNSGDVRRSTDLSAAGIIVHLKFWAKVIGVEGNEWIRCQISPNGTTWTTVREWDKSFSNKNIWVSYDIPLDSYQMTSQFWIRFIVNLKHSSDYFYVDKIQVVNLDFYTITATAGGRTIKAVVQMNGGTPIVRYWYFV